MKGNLVSQERFQELRILSNKLGFQFHSYELLHQAFVHTSYLNEDLQQASDNECLEFLGDSVLNLVVSEFLYGVDSLINEREGRLSYFRRGLVSNDFLAEISNSLSLNSYLLLGKSLSNKKLSKKVQADVFEALIAVIYLDQGYERVKFFLLPNLKKKLKKIQKEYGHFNFNSKVKLQEFTQKKWNTLPIYKVQGIVQKSNYQIFTTRVQLPYEKYQAVGKGKSKKESEINAASNLISKLEI